MSPMVEVETVDMVSAGVQETVNPEKHAGLGEEQPQSEYETDNDQSGDEWESDSLYDDAIAFLRDEQLREGGIYTRPIHIRLEH